MIDREVERLRRLRATALRVRTVARALGRTVSAAPAGSPRDELLNRGRCAAWRVARTVSGRLRAHPYASFQKDPGIGVVVANSLVAANAVLGVKTRQQGLLRFGAHLRSLARELSDVRALTSASDLNDSFGRSEIEIRALLAALAHETSGLRIAEAAVIPPVTSARGAAAADPDWPFLAF
jgi:hypothetical protein